MSIAGMSRAVLSCNSHVRHGSDAARPRRDRRTCDICVPDSVTIACVSICPTKRLLNFHLHGPLYQPFRRRPRTVVPVRRGTAGCISMGYPKRWPALLNVNKTSSVARGWDVSRECRGSRTQERTVRHVLRAVPAADPS
jgi:hypothetical protein